MKKITVLTIVGLISFSTLYAQSIKEIQALQKVKKDSIAKLEREITQLQNKIDSLPGWETGAFGTIGLNIAHFNNWFQKEIANSAGGTIGIIINGFANYDDARHFLQNSGTLNLGWVKFDDQDDPDDEDGYRQATDLFNVSSLYGRKLSKTWAASAQIEYRSSILSDFNDPGYLDLGIGGTWKPAKGLFITVHPLNANLVFANAESIFESSFGAKLVADYSRKYSNGISFKTNFSGFISYRDINRSNWTWSNAFSYKLWKIFGIGIEGGLRGNRQETLDYEINKLGNEDATFDTVDNKLQSYFLAGISYKF